MNLFDNVEFVQEIDKLVDEALDVFNTSDPTERRQEIAELVGQAVATGLAVAQVAVTLTPTPFDDLAVNLVKMGDLANIIEKLIAPETQASGDS